MCLKKKSAKSVGTFRVLNLIIFYHYYFLVSFVVVIVIVAARAR